MDANLTIKVEITKRRLRQRQIAIHLGVAESYLSDCLTGIKPLNDDFVKRIYQAMDELAPIPTPAGVDREP
jgi:predicted XRE-type DNA-binding protein